MSLKRVVWSFTALFVVLFVLFNCWLTSAHEDVHVQIHKMHGCTNVTKSVNYLEFSGKTLCNKYFDNGTMTDDERREHNLNEIHSYQFTALTNALLIVGFMISITILSHRKTEEKG